VDRASADNLSATARRFNGKESPMEALVVSLLLWLNAHGFAEYKVEEK
jgi:hypothetical protein